MYKPKDMADLVKQPPKVIKELKTIRFVSVQVPLAKDSEGKVLSYTDELIIEERNYNAMNEPYWQLVRSIYPINSLYSSNSYEDVLFVKVIKEFLELDK